MAYKDYAKTKEYSKLYMRKYRQKHKDKIRLQQNKYNEQHRSQVRQLSREFYRKNPLKMKEYNLKQYGLTLEDYTTLLYEQENKCLICGREFTDENKVYIDHNHKNGKVRGLLCRSCNGGLGFFGDSKDILLKAIYYLETTL